MRDRVIDANVIMRFLLADHPDQSERSKALFTRLRDGTETAFLPEIVVCDTVWTLQSFYKWPTDRIRRFIEDLVTLRGIRMARRPIVLQALYLFAEQDIDFSDALIAAEMLQAGWEEIYSYDRDFDRVPGLRRVEP